MLVGLGAYDRSVCEIKDSESKKPGEASGSLETR